MQHNKRIEAAVVAVVPLWRAGNATWLVSGTEPCSGQKEGEALVEAARARQHRVAHTTAIATRLSSARAAPPAVPGTLPAGEVMSQCCAEALARGTRAQELKSTSSLEKLHDQFQVLSQRARIRSPAPQQRKLH